MFVVVYGGSGSGKSEIAEQIAVEMGDKRRVYLATMKVYGDEGRRKVERHRRLREGKRFETMECEIDLKNVDKIAGGCVLLECMSNLVANELYEKGGAKEDTRSAVRRGIERLVRFADNLVVVTNDVFREGVNYGVEMGEYQQVLSEVNQDMACQADYVLEVLFGQIIVHKGEGWKLGKEDRTKVCRWEEGKFLSNLWRKQMPYCDWKGLENGMTVICGGSYQGKLLYVLEKMGMEEGQIEDGELCPVEIRRMKGMDRLHLFIRRAMEEGKDPWGLVEGIAEENPDMVWLVDEIGCGLVPVDAFEREYREQVGRISCELAKRAVRVIRMQLGIATDIKRGLIE